MTVRIPADVDLEDKLLGNLTARQLIILGMPGAGLYLLWSATRGLLTLPVFAALAFPLAAAVIALALGRREGLSMDRWVLAAAAHLLATRSVAGSRRAARTRRTPTDVEPAPALPGLRRPARAATMSRAPVRTIRAHNTTTATAGVGVAEGFERLDGGAGSVGVGAVVDLGPDGSALLAAVSTVNIALRTQDEQLSLVASFGALLNSLTSPIQVLIRAMPLDLTSHISELQHAAATLAHPALAAAAADHAAHLAELGDTEQLLRRQCFLVLREPHPDASEPSPPRHGHDEPPEPKPAGPRRSTRDKVITTRLLRRLGEAADLLAPAGLTVTPLDARQAAAILRAESALPSAPNPAPGPLDDWAEHPGPVYPGRVDSGDYGDLDQDNAGEVVPAQRYGGDHRHQLTDPAGQPPQGRGWLLADPTSYLYAPGELEELERVTPPATSAAGRRPHEARAVREHPRPNRAGRDREPRSEHDEAESGWYPVLASPTSGQRR